MKTRFLTLPDLPLQITQVIGEGEPEPAYRQIREYHARTPEAYELPVITDIRRFFGMVRFETFAEHINLLRAARVALGLTPFLMKPQIYLNNTEHHAVQLDQLYAAVGRPPTLMAASTVEECWAKLGRTDAVPAQVRRFLKD